MLSSQAIEPPAASAPVPPVPTIPLAGVEAKVKRKSYQRLRDETVPSATAAPDIRIDVDKENTDTSVPPLVQKDDPLTQQFANHLLSIIVHETDVLRPNVDLKHPVVRVHVIGTCMPGADGSDAGEADRTTGQYLEKSVKERKVTAPAESRFVSHILPIITRPYMLRGKVIMKPEWEDELRFNEDYLHVIRKKGVLVFEILDFAGVNSSAGDGYQRIAWAFLHVVNGKNELNSEKRVSFADATELNKRQVRLQLYKYPKGADSWGLFATQTVTQGPHDNPLFFHLLHGKRVEYHSTMYITVRGVPAMAAQEVLRRPGWAMEVERGRLTYEEVVLHGCPRKLTACQMLRQFEAKQSGMDIDSLTPGVKKNPWQRIPGQQCKIPNEIKFKIDPGKM